MPTDPSLVHYHPRMPTTTRLRSALLAVALTALAACSSPGAKKNDDEEKDAATVAAAGAESAGTSGDAAAAAPAVSTLPITQEEVTKAFELRKEGFRRANASRMSQNAGTIVVTATFAPTGEVVECRMLSTDFREDPEFNALVMTEVWRVRIAPRPPQAGEFTVNDYSIAFSARSEAEQMPMSVPKLSPLSSTGPQVWEPRSNRPR